MFYFLICVKFSSYSDNPHKQTHCDQIENALVLTKKFGSINLNTVYIHLIQTERKAT